MQKKSKYNLSLTKLSNSLFNRHHGKIFFCKMKFWFREKYFYLKQYNWLNWTFALTKTYPNRKKIHILEQLGNSIDVNPDNYQLTKKWADNGLLVQEQGNLNYFSSWFKTWGFQLQSTCPWDSHADFLELEKLARHSI